MRDDPYAALGVDPGADRAAIRAAYLRLMREHHPDRHPGDRAAEKAARELNAAFHVLGDEARRAAYDRLREPREGGLQVRAGAVAEQDPSATITTVRPAAYGKERAAYQRTFSAATIRFAIALLLLGAVFLLAFIPPLPPG